MIRILITGAAGFIGYHLSGDLCRKGYEVTGQDNLPDSSDLPMKLERLRSVGIRINDTSTFTEASAGNFRFVKMDLCNRTQVKSFFDSNSFDLVIHLASQSSVRKSEENAFSLTENNVSSFINLLQSCKNQEIKNIIYASSSNVYGLQKEMPYHEKMDVNKPVSLYAATKRATELQAETYANLYGMCIRGIRFFTVYGPWVRTDMAAWLFMNAIWEKRPIKLNNNGEMQRDFTYIGDVVHAIDLIINKMQDETGGHEIFNVAPGNPISIRDFLAKIEDKLGIKAIINNRPIQEGELKATYGDSAKLFAYTGYKPGTDIDKGIERMINWFREFKKNLV